MFRMPQYLCEVLAANECATARDMAVAADRVWDLRQSAPATPAAYPPRERSASPCQHSRNSDRGRDSSHAADRGRLQSRRRG